MLTKTGSGHHLRDTAALGECMVVLRQTTPRAAIMGVTEC